jgi:hypothetical protein
MQMTDVEKAVLELESVGVIHRRGEFRNGRPLYDITEFGRQLDDACRADGSFSQAIDRLVEQRKTGWKSIELQGLLPLV